VSLVSKTFGGHGHQFLGGDPTVAVLIFSGTVAMPWMFSNCRQLPPSPDRGPASPGMELQRIVDVADRCGESISC